MQHFKWRLQVLRDYYEEQENMDSLALQNELKELAAEFENEQVTLLAEINLKLLLNYSFYLDILNITEINAKIE